MKMLAALELQYESEAQESVPIGPLCTIDNVRRTSHAHCSRAPAGSPTPAHQVTQLPSTVHVRTVTRTVRKSAERPRGRIGLTLPVANGRSVES